MRVAHPGVDPGALSGEVRRVSRIGGDVRQLIGVPAQVVEFLAGAFPEDAREERPAQGVMLMGEQEVLGRGRIDVAERAAVQEEIIRIAGRPAVGAEIADVEEIAGPDRAHRVAEVTVAHVGMAFAFDEDRLAAGGGFAAEQARQAAHRHRRGRPQSGGVEEGRGEVAEVHEGVDLPRRRGRLAPADRERHPGALVIAIAEAAGHLPTVVGAIDDQGLVEFPRGFERRQHGGGFAVHPDDTAVIIQQVEPHLFAVGQLGRNRQPGRIESGLPGVIEVRPLAGFRRRVGVAHPEEERLTRTAGLQESFEARELRADRILFPAGDLDVAGRPRFALVADRIAGLAEQLRDDRRILREAAPERGAFAEFMDGAAGEQARAAR